MPPPIKVYFLGTGGTTPFGLRKMPCIALKYENYLIQFDFGEYCQYSLISHGLHPFRSKTYILISHYHVDHVGGLPPFLHTYNIVEPKRDIVIVGPTGLKSFLSGILNIFGLTGIENKIKMIEVGVPGRGILEKIIDEKAFQIYAFGTAHGIPSLGYIFLEKQIVKLDKEKLKEFNIPEGPIRRKLLQGENITIGGRIIKPEDVTVVMSGRKIVYTGDTAVFDELARIIDGADLVIHEATYVKREHGKLAEQRYHATIEDACSIAMKARVKCLALIHLSPRYKDRMADISKLVDEIVDNRMRVLIPEDGYTMEL